MNVAGTVRAFYLFILVLTLPTPSLATADLAVTLESWAQAPGTTDLTFVIKVENLGSDPFLPTEISCSDFPPELMFFYDQEAQPTGQETQETFEGSILPALSPGESETIIVNKQYFPGTFTIWAIVDTAYFAEAAFPGAGFSACFLPEAPKTNNAAGPISITVTDPNATDNADLKIVNLTAEVSGAQVKYTAVVANQGGADAPDGFKVDVLFDTPGGACPPTEWQSPGISLFGDVFLDVPGGIPAGETATVELNGSPGVGSHTSCAMVDLDNVVLESDETNNFSSPVTFFINEAPPQECADLDITVFSVQALNADITYEVQVTNVGTGPATAFTVNLYEDSLTAPVVGQPTSHVWAVSSLGVGQTWSDTITLQTVKNGAKKAWVWADSESVIDECSSDNNQEGPYPYTVFVPDNKADLVVSGAITSASLGTNLCFFVNLLNQGQSPATNAEVDFFFDVDFVPDCLDPAQDLSQVPSVTQVVPVLEAGALITLDFCLEDAPEGDYSAYVLLDCFQSLDETDETNNAQGPIPATHAITDTNGPDLKLQVFQGKTRCTNIDYVATVCNVGDEPAPPFQLDLYYNADSNPNFDSGPGDKTVFYGSVDDGTPGLTAGECLDITIKRTATPSGTYRSWIVVDTANTVTEASDTNPLGEGNNIAFVEVVVDEQACLCPDNELITAECSCGGETVIDGFCCFGDYSPEAFETCEEIPDNPEDTTVEREQDDDLGSGSRSSDATDGQLGAIVDVDANLRTRLGDGCQTTPSNIPGPIAPALMCLALALLWRRHSKSTYSP